MELFESESGEWYVPQYLSIFDFDFPSFQVCISMSPRAGVGFVGTPIFCPSLLYGIVSAM